MLPAEGEACGRTKRKLQKRRTRRNPAPPASGRRAQERRAPASALSHMRALDDSRGFGAAASPTATRRRCGAVYCRPLRSAAGGRGGTRWGARSWGRGPLRRFTARCSCDLRTSRHVAERPAQFGERKTPADDNRVSAHSDWANEKVGEARTASSFPRTSSP